MTGPNDKKMEFALEINDLTVSYKDKPVLWDIDLEIPQGALVGIVGPNGAGKTTLIKSILGLLKPVAGSAKIRLFSPDPSPMLDRLERGGQQLPVAGIDATQRGAPAGDRSLRSCSRARASSLCRAPADPMCWLWQRSQAADAARIRTAR